MAYSGDLLNLYIENIYIVGSNPTFPENDKKEFQITKIFDPYRERKKFKTIKQLTQLVECFAYNEEVSGSSPLLLTLL